MYQSIVLNEGWGVGLGLRGPSPGNFEKMIGLNSISCVLGSFLQFVAFFPSPTVQQIRDDQWVKVANLPSQSLVA